MITNSSQSDSADVAARIPHTGKAKNLQLQWLRALAALMVVLFHTSVYLPPSALSVFDYRFGVFGVALFFALSGYLMSVAITVQKPFVFLAHRIIRIYPVFLLACALFYLVAWLLGMPVPIDWSALSLAPVDSADYPLGIEWTLVFEVSFYIALFFIGLAGLGRHIVWLAAAWLIYLAAASWNFPDSRYLLVTILRVAEDAAMAGGLLIPLLLRARLPPISLLLIGFACFLPIYGYLPPNSDVYRWIAGLAAVLVVTGAVGISQRYPGLGDNSIGRLLARFGDYSYVLYLIHVPILRFVSHGLSYLPGSIIWPIAVGLVIGISILFGRADTWLYIHMKRAANVAPSWVRNSFVLVFLGVFFWTSGKVTYAWYQAQGLQDFASGAQMLLAEKSASTPEDVEAVALSLGWRKSDKLVGAVDRAQWQGGALMVQGWAADMAKHPKPVALALFDNGALVDVKIAITNRPDVGAALHTYLLLGYAFNTSKSCQAGKPILLAFTEDERFATIADPQPAITCATLP